MRWSGMKTLAVQYRAAQLVAHQLHHTVKGASFLADHEYLGELYAAYETAYDAVVERMIGLKMPITLSEVGTQAAALASRVTTASPDPERWFATLLGVETSIRKEIDSCMGENPTNGTQNLLQGLADESEARVYKLRQRAG